MKSLLSWLFAWLGIPLLFAAAVHLTNAVVWGSLGLMFALLAAGIFLVKECLRPRAAWVTPVYAGVMLVVLFAVLALISLPLSGDL